MRELYQSQFLIRDKSPQVVDWFLVSWWSAAQSPRRVAATGIAFASRIGPHAVVVSLGLESRLRGFWSAPYGADFGCAPAGL